ncbi:3-hydroxyalkanoate synthetase, partial [Pseudomonas sp. MWU12-2534b]
WERDEMLRLKKFELEQHYSEGGAVDGFLRLLIYVAIGNGVVDVRPFNAIRRVMQDTGLGEELTLEAFKQVVRRQTWLVRNDEKRALATVKDLLPTDQQREMALELVMLLLSAAGPISVNKQQRLGRMALAMGVSGSRPEGALAASTLLQPEPAKKPRASRSRKSTAAK